MERAASGMVGQGPEEFGARVRDGGGSQEARDGVVEPLNGVVVGWRWMA